MGLLRKAAGEKTGRVAQGLLGKSLHARGQASAPVAAAAASEAPPVPPAPPPRDSAQLAEELKAAVSSLPDDVELPARLFAAASAGLEIRKGALLLFDPQRLVYAPWASQGYDQTTLHRLRIPPGVTASFSALANGEPLILSDPAELAPYQPFFSTREFSSQERLVLAPLLAGDRLIGVLMVSELRAPGLDDEGLRQVLKALAQAGSERADKAREKRLALAGGAGAARPASPEEQASRFLDAGGAAARPALFLSLSLEEFASGILADNRYLDPFRLHEDIRLFLGAFLSDVGIVLAVRPGVYTVGLRFLDSADIDLFTHQLGLFLDGLFRSGRSAPGQGPRVLKRRSWPAEGNDVRSLLEFLAS